MKFIFYFNKRKFNDILIIRKMRHSTTKNRYNSNTATRYKDR